MNRRVRLARLSDLAARVIGGAVVFGIIGVAVFIVGYLLYKGAGAISIAFLTQAPRNAMREGGIMPAIVGTAALVLGTALFALPVGISAGVYLAEYAPKGRTSRLIRLAIANMAGVPSIVYGIFGVAAFVYIAGFGQSILAGSLTLACLTLPVVITATEEALRQVPKDLRQASLALGASRLRTTFRIVLPAALPGVVTGSLLGLSRAAGETAPILFTAAVFFAPRLPASPSRIRMSTRSSRCTSRVPPRRRSRPPRRSPRPRKCTRSPSWSRGWARSTGAK
jgi:phosphate transport system permease protein